MTRFGYNYLDVPDKAFELGHAKRAQVGGGLFFQDEQDFARGMKQALPGANIVIRNYPDGALPPSVDHWLKHNRPLGEGGLIVQTVNEVGYGPASIQFHIDLLERMKRERDKMNVGILAQSVGTPGADDWYMAEKLLRLVADMRDQVHLILHEYYGGHITSGFIGGNPMRFLDPKTWPQDTRDITMWHVGRYRFLKKYCRKIGVPLPRLIIGEFGADYTGDIGEWLKTLHSTGGAYDTVDGWHDLMDQWRQWWPQWDAATAYFEQAKYADQHIYTDAEVETILFFARWTDGKWNKYRVDNAIEGHMERYAKEQAATPPPTQPETPPIQEPPIVVVPPETPTLPPDEETEPAWMDRLTAGERARIEMGRLLAKYGAAMRALVVDDDAYILIAKLAAMLDAKS